MNFATEPDEDDRCHLCRMVKGYDDLPLKIECYECDTYKRKKNESPLVRNNAIKPGN